MRYYCLACEKLIEVDSDDPKALSQCPVCKGELEDGGLAPGTEINGYEIIEELGRGSYGIVYCAKQLNLERDVALKILSRNHEEEDFVINFFREARAAAGLSHPNVVQAYDAGITDDGTCYFAMELVDGETVDDKLENEGALRADEAYNIALKIAGAMEYAWDRRKLTHGDIKPENIIISRRGEPKLADLGLAKSAFDDDVGHIAATPLYAPPEVIKRSVDSVNVQTDIYSFGGTVYHMFAGVPPFNEEDSEKVMKMHLYDKHEPLYKRVPVITRSLSDFVDRMLAKDPADRPESWSEIVEFLEGSAEDSFRVVETETTVTPHKSSRFERLVPIGLITILVGVTGWFIWDYFTGGKASESGSQKAPEAGMTADAPQKIPNETRWLRLKLNLEKMSPGEACKKIDSFLQRYQLLAPAVQDDISKTREAYAKTESERLAKLALEQKVNSEYEQMLEDIEFAAKKETSNKEKSATVKRVNNFLSRLEQNEEMAAVLGRGKWMNLSAKVKLIQQKVKERVRKRIQYVQQKQTKVWDDYKKEQNRRTLEIREMFKNINAKNRWYQALNSFITLPADKRTRQEFIKSLGKISKAKLTPKQKEFYNFATTLYPEKIDLLPILVKYRDTFIGKALPWPDREHGGGDFKVKKVDKDFIFMYGKIAEGAFSGFKLYWNKLSVAQQYLMLGKWLLPDESKLTREDKITIAFWILEKNNQRTFYNFVGRYLKPEDALMCRELMHELLSSRRESAAADAFMKINASWDKHQYNVTAMEIFDFSKHYGMTNCQKNASKLIDKLEKHLRLWSPVPRAISGANDSGRALDRSDLEKMLSETTYTANHSLKLPVIKEVTRVRIQDNLTSAFTQIAAKSGRRRGGIMRGASISPLNAAIMAANMRRRYLPAGMKECYNVALRFYAGDMLTAAKDKGWLDKFMAKYRTLPNLSSKILLGAGMAADLYLTTRESRQMDSVFESVIRSNVAGKDIRKAYMEYLSRLSAGEFALFTRRYSRMHRILNISERDAVNLPKELNRIRFCQLIGAVSALKSTPDSLKKIDISFQNLYQKLDSANNAKPKRKKIRRSPYDSLWINSVIELLDGDATAFEKLPDLSQCQDPQLSAVLLTSAVACTEPASGMLHKTVKLCEEVIGDEVSATELWYRLMLLEFVGAQSPNELYSLLERFDNDKRAVAQPYVSRMTFVASIIRLLTDETDLKTEAGVFKSFHYQLTMALPGERDAELLFSGKLTAKDLDKRASRYGVKSVYWPAMLGTAIAIRSNRKDAGSYIKVLEKYSASLLPEERLLMQRMPLILKAVWNIKK